MASRNTTNKGKGLSRGPALVVGSILLAFGLIAMIKHSAFPSFGSGFPDGSVKGGKFLGIEVNGWTNWIAAVAGGLLLFGAAQHILAKLMSLIVGIVLGALAIIALVDGDMLGLGAANIWTIIGFGAAAVALLINTVLPRIGGDKDDDDDETSDEAYARRQRERRVEQTLPETGETVRRDRAASASRSQRS